MTSTWRTPKSGVWDGGDCFLRKGRLIQPARVDCVGDQPGQVIMAEWTTTLPSAPTAKDSDSRQRRNPRSIRNSESFIGVPGLVSICRSTAC